MSMDRSLKSAKSLRFATAMSSPAHALKCSPTRKNGPITPRAFTGSPKVAHRKAALAKIEEPPPRQPSPPLAPLLPCASAAPLPGARRGNPAGELNAAPAAGKAGALPPPPPAKPPRPPRK